MTDTEAGSRQQRIDRYAMLSFLVPLLVYVITLNGVYQSDYPTSILGTQWAVWKYHSFSLGPPGGLLVQTVDKGLFNGEYYSAISPGIGILSLPFAAAGFILDGNSLDLFGNALILDELFLAIGGAVAALFVYKISRLYARPLPSFIAALSLGLGTSVWPFATTMFIHDASLPFSVAAVYCVLKYVKAERRSVALLALGGFCLGISSFIEYFAALLIVPILVYLFLSRARVRDAALALSAFLVGPLLQVTFNYEVFGDPLLFPEQLKSGSTGLVSQFDFLGMIPHASYYLASPYRGVFLLSPVLTVGAYGLYRMYRSPKTKTDAVLFAALFLTILLPYSAWQDWAGGLAYGPRFLILGLPYLTVPIAFVLTGRPSNSMKAGFTSLFALSSLIEGGGALTTAFSVAGGPSLYQPLSLNIPWLIEGKLDTWWLARTGEAASSVHQLFAALLLVSLWCFVALIVARLRDDTVVLDSGRREAEEPR